ncbi:peptidase inhibitor family I36 protein [Microbacterium saperdae]|uniref:Peptidase inhibitor family I36 n=1 Tax=Microbacterium saperdae TaxID=69368 RepID=A0A543BAH6_9MICO|nr:peptidase inhibitor family I36 protein [Microbacterium saperdae]TQL81851.1 peptidase inhibitor family I36 [Microbacterium saperdae]GGM35271.1 hypothetical protein GCM10010489_02660 [Microbacterium saperdae]
MHRPRTLLATAALVLVALINPTAASATTPPATAMQERVEDIIDEYGGVQTGWNEVAWDEGAIILTIDPDDSTLAGTVSARAEVARDNCAAGKYCAYGKAGYGGNKLTYSACPATHTSFSIIGSPRSIKNNRTSGTVKAYNGSTLKTTLTAGNGNSNTTGVTKITCT